MGYIYWEYVNYWAKTSALESRCFNFIRDNYNANDIRPGLTGWAQINGRDELELETKAKLDGEYVKRESLSFDIKCFIGTIFKVAKSEGIVEGKKSNEKTNGKPIKEKIKLKQ